MSLIVFVVTDRTKQFVITSACGCSAGEQGALLRHQIVIYKRHSNIILHHGTAHRAQDGYRNNSTGSHQKMFVTFSTHKKKTTKKKKKDNHGRDSGL
jgi:hypothetical protein